MPLAVTGASLDGMRVGLRTGEDGRIAEVGPGVVPADGDEVIAAGGMALLPGLVNAHTHAAMTLFRGYADDLPLMEWLHDHIWPAEAKLDAEDVYWGTRLACAEMIRTGTVAFWDMYWQPGATARAVLDSGLRAAIGAPLIDGGGDGDPVKIERDAAAAFAELAEAGGGDRILPTLAPHAIYTVSEPALRWIGEESRRREMPVQIHVSETRGEVEDCLAAHGVRPVELLERVGLLGPRTLLAHAVWIDDAERELIAASGATIATNPVANMKLAVGRAFDLAAARAAGIPVGLGTDGAGSNNSLDLISDAKHLALIQKHRAADASAAPAGEVLAIAAGGAAPLLGGTGRIEAGGAADFLLVRTDSPELCLGSLAAGVVYAASGAVVDTTVAAGRVLMRGGEVEGVGEIVERARERAGRLGLR